MGWSGAQFSKEDAKRIKIGRDGRFCALQYLGRHVGEGSSDDAWGTIGLTGQTEIGYDSPERAIAIQREDYIFRLQVAMNQLIAVSFGEAVAKLQGNGESFFSRKCRAMNT